MAIAHDTDSNSGAVGNVATYSWSHTCTGSNLDLVVAVLVYYPNIGTTTVTSVTYNGVAVTVQKFQDFPSAFFAVWIGNLVAPASGSNTISVTLSRALGGVNCTIGFASSYTGVHQSSPIDASGIGVNGTAIANGATITQNLTTVNANAWIVDCCALATALAGSAPIAPEVQRNLAVANIYFGTADNGPIVTPASTSDGWTMASFSTSNASLATFSLNPASAGAALVGEPFLFPTQGPTWRI